MSPPTASPSPAPSSSPRLGTQGLVAAAGLVAGVTLLSRAVGLARWVAFSHALGVTCVGDVYARVNQVPNVMFEVAAGGALAAVAVPLVARHLALGEEDLADRTASALLGWTLLVLLPLSLIVAAAAGPLAGLLVGDAATGCSPHEARAAGRLMLLLFAPQVLLYGVGIVLTGVLQAHRRFLAAAVAPLLSSLVVIGVYLAFGAAYDATAPLGDLPTRALVLLAGGTTLGVAALSLPLLLPAARLGVRWRPTLRFPSGSGRVAGALALAGIVTVAAQQIFTVVVLLLTRGEVGAMPVWNYAQTMYLLPYAVLVVPLATAAFPRLTDEPDAARRTLRGTLVGAGVAGVAGAGALVAARTEVAQVFLALDRGRDSAARGALEALAPTLALLAPGLVGFGLVAVLTRALYAAHRARAAATGAATGWLVAAALPVTILAPDLMGEQPGAQAVLTVLALGSSIGMTSAAVLLAMLTRATWGPDSLRGTARALAVAMVGAVLGVLGGEVLPVTVVGWGAAVLWGSARGVLVLLGVAGAVLLLDREAWQVVRVRAWRASPSPAEPGQGS